MKIFSWNYRGLQQAAAIRALLNVQKRRSSDIIFLMETHLDEFPAECLRQRTKMDHKYVVRSNGRSGGLLLLWKKEVDVSLRDKTENFVDVFVGSGSENFWRLTGFYGEPKWKDKHLSWDRLRALKSVVDMPWMVMGDMNEIMFSFEKEGGNDRPNHFMQSFRDVIAECNLSDHGFIGDKFTWHRALIRERLDRALVNEGWNEMFPGAVLEHLDYYKSDHRPIIMNLHEEITQEAAGQAVLRFEARWLKEEKFCDVVKQAWQSTEGNMGLAEKLAWVHKQLHAWDKTVLKKSSRKIKNVQRELEQVARDTLTHQNAQRQKDLAEELERLLQMEEIHWAQRSRINWLMFGDKNTSYFHNFASARRLRNRITKLRDDQGAWLEGTDYLNPFISDYFAGLFSIEIGEPDLVFLEKVNPRVTSEMNEALLKPYTAEEVKKALFSIWRHEGAWG